MATSTSQRVGIWIIAIVLTLGTLGSFLVMALSVQNQSIDDAQSQQIEKVYEEYQDALAVQAADLSNKYYSDFSKYADVPKKFDAEAIKDLATSDIKVGDGDVVSSETEYSAYYIGWNPEGVVFDQSISGSSLKSPIAGGNLIEGWDQGVIGMRIGGVREISIPSGLAYGESGSGENIPPNTPIKFVVMIIPKVDEVPIPKLLLDYYGS